MFLFTRSGECDDWMLPTSTIIFDLLYHHQLATMALFKVISEINNSINHNMTLWENGYKTRYLCVGFLNSNGVFWFKHSIINGLKSKKVKFRGLWSEDFFKN